MRSDFSLNTIRSLIIADPPVEGTINEYRTTTTSSTVDYYYKLYCRLCKLLMIKTTESGITQMTSINTHTQTGRAPLFGDTSLLRQVSS